MTGTAPVFQLAKYLFHRFSYKAYAGEGEDEQEDGDEEESMEGMEMLWEKV